MNEDKWKYGIRNVTETEHKRAGSYRQERYIYKLICIQTFLERERMDWKI